MWYQVHIIQTYATSGRKQRTLAKENEKPNGHERTQHRIRLWFKKKKKAVDKGKEEKKPFQ